MPHPEPHVNRYIREAPPSLQREGQGKTGEMFIWETREADITVKCACKVCNNGWMDRLDKATERVFLSAAVKGEACRVDDLAEQYELARWCSLIAVLMSQTQRNPTVENQTAAAVRQGAVPVGVRIWTFRTEPRGSGHVYWAVGSKRQDLGHASDVNAYFVTFGLNHFGAQVFMPTSRTPVGLKFQRGRNERVLRRLWPSPEQPFVWPPPTIPWDDNLTRLINAFTPQ
jgi:hypothetical protein